MARWRTEPTAGGGLLTLVREHRVLSLAACAGVALAVYLLATRFLPGERSRIARTVVGLADALSTGSAEEFLEHISPDFSSGRMDYEAFSRAVRHILGRGPVNVQRWDFVVLDVADDSAVAEVRVVATQRGPYRRGPGHSLWELGFVKREGRWLVTSARPLRITVAGREQPSLEWLVERAMDWQ